MGGEWKEQAAPDEYAERARTEVPIFRGAKLGLPVAAEVPP